jgi:hypothetical protein
VRVLILLIGNFWELSTHEGFVQRCQSSGTLHVTEASRDGTFPLFLSSLSSLFFLKKNELWKIIVNAYSHYSKYVKAMQPHPDQT